MKSSVGTIFILLLFSSCTEFIAAPDLQEDWEVLETEKNILHYRPAGFSGTASPTAAQADTIATNQAFYYKTIQDSTGVNFSDKVLIYLFNEDEAGLHIGTNGGGHSIPKLNAFYFTFVNHERSYTDQYGIKNPKIGAHELVHVITHRKLGYPGTKLMSEGYANWLDGSYSYYHIDDILKSYQENNPEKILTPQQLLTDTGLPESVYYPNSGVFVRFLVNRHGIEKVNRLFTVQKNKFKPTFEKVCNESWEAMSGEYEIFIREYKKTPEN
jgi:hypothetical protein